MVTNKTDWELPTLEATYSNYVRRRQEILSYLIQDYPVSRIAKETDRSVTSIYTDISKLRNETETWTIWGAIIEAVKRGWVEIPGTGD
jgi:predicted DNA-binding protein YlxM (UPF0122 family)